MLLLHQAGSVHVGEVVRYTVTYTPSADRILPAPPHLHVKVKNTSAIPLRAAYLHGPYALYVACYPSSFDPTKKHENYQVEGAPDFEPNLKAGGHWNSKLSIPPEIRDAAGTAPSRQSVDGNARSFSWIIEVASQVIFSTSAAVHFEILVGRDERSVELGFYPTVGAGQGAPGQVEDHLHPRFKKSAQAKGIYSKAVRLAVDTTITLWNSPAFPTWKDDQNDKGGSQTKEQVLGYGEDKQQKQERPARKKQKVHLVVVTHGIHSNVGADMLYIKESIDATAKQARKDARARRAQVRAEQLKQEDDVRGYPRSMSAPDLAMAPTTSLLDDHHDEDEDDEQVIVRGFGENVIRTERGIQYLGKRLAKYVLSITYPDQPYLPVKSSISRTIARSFTGQKPADGQPQPAHSKSSIYKDEEHVNDDLAYQISSISFVGHSLGGLTQTYAIAYIKKHSPEFFDKIKPINFIAMATPFLGLSNENPIYVKFALDFGLVGRTGQDLGLTWRAPNMVRSGWGAMIGGLGSETQKAKSEGDPGAKPLLRVLPTGPAHAALKLFRNRTVYSNVVNDGIVPLRTSCLLFLDWRGLGRVDKARRDNGIVGTMVGWGWAEMMGQNASSSRPSRPWADLFGDSGEESDAKRPGRQTDHGDDVPQPDANVMNEDNISAHHVSMEPKPHQFLRGKPLENEKSDREGAQKPSSPPSSNAWSGFLALFKPQGSSKAHRTSPKNSKIYHRSQTTRLSREADLDSVDHGESLGAGKRSSVRGSSLYSEESAGEDVETPPRTSFFESAGDLLNPPLPSKEFFLDPAARPRTIFHDRVYHPGDIPAPVTKDSRSLIRRPVSRESAFRRSADRTPNKSSHESSSPTSTAGTRDMKVEEKIARAYHRDLSWRKVLVRLEPDAHNNMIVRRMFANAYGWPVIKHMCDTHFAFTASAVTEDSLESNVERAQGTQEVGQSGEQVQGQEDPPAVGEGETSGRDTGLARRRSEGDQSPAEVPSHSRERLQGPPTRTDSEIREASDEVPDMGVTSGTAESSMSGSGVRLNVPYRLSRQDSARWSDGFFEGSDDDSDVDYLSSPMPRRADVEDHSHSRGTSDAEIASFLGKPEPSIGSPKPLVAQNFTSPPRPLRGCDDEPNPTDLSEGAMVADAVMVGMTGLGLGTHVEEQIRRKERRKSVTEQVALATAEQERKKAGC